MNPNIPALAPRRMPTPRDLSFSEKEFRDANEAWGCNCGPGALAFMLSLKPDDVRPFIPGFDDRHYTNPTMMGAALRGLCMSWQERDDSDCNEHTLCRYGLVRIQWDGPWMTPKPGRERWAISEQYRKTHWVGSFTEADGTVHVYDINAGRRLQEQWEETVIPPILEMYKGATGWHATHRWELIFPGELEAR